MPFAAWPQGQSEGTATGRGLPQLDFILAQASIDNASDLGPHSTSCFRRESPIR